MKPCKRRVTTIEGEETVEDCVYDVSTSERLLEEMCQYFGTSLLPADIVSHLGDAILVRSSKPVILINPSNERRLIQFQYSRFSPLSSDKWQNIYNENRSKQKGKRKLISDQSIDKDLRKRYYNLDPFDIVTDRKYIDFLNLARFRKELYFLVHKVKPGSKTEDIKEPFLIHDPQIFRGAVGELPDLFIKLKIEPVFFIGENREDTTAIFDTLSVKFPRIESRHREGIEHAINSITLNPGTPNFQREEANFAAEYKIHTSVDRLSTMRLIYQYLNILCLGRSL